MKAGSQFYYDKDTGTIREETRVALDTLSGMFSLVNIHIQDKEWFEKVEEQKQVNPILWEPNNEYYFIDENNNIFSTHLVVGDSSPKYLIGNAYKTVEDAQRALDRRLAYMELIRAIAEANEDWKPDWKDATQAKWYFICLPGILIVDLFSLPHNRCLPDELYIRSYEVGSKIIKALGDDKIKLAMGWE